jgi:hypothetical protein
MCELSCYTVWSDVPLAMRHYVHAHQHRFRGSFVQKKLAVKTKQWPVSLASWYSLVCGVIHLTIIGAIFRSLWLFNYSASTL